MKKDKHTITSLSGIRPLGDRVLVRPLEASHKEKKTATGIYIPENNEHEKPERGIVVATGPGRREDGALVPVEVKAGDTVVFSKYGYDEVKDGDDTYFIIKEDNILAIIK